jgi:hypothetical protein
MITAQKNNSHVWVVVIVAVSAVAIATMVLLKAPFWAPGDIFSYLGYSQTIVDFHHFEFLSLSGVPVLYTFFPLLFAHIASWSLLSGMSVPVATVLTNLLMIALYPLSFYVVSLQVVRDRRCATVAAILGLTMGNALANTPHPNETFPILSTLTFSFLFFAVSLSIYFKILSSRTRIDVRFLVLFFLIELTTILFHPQSSIFRGSIFAVASLFFLIVSQRSEKRFFFWLTVVSVLPWCVFLAMNLSFVGDFVSIGKDVAVNNSLQLGGEAPRLDLLAPFGGLLSLAFLVGLLLLFRIKMRLAPYTQSFFTIYVVIIVLMSLQQYIGLSFFPGRFSGELFLPVVVLGSIGIVKGIDVLRVRFLMKIVLLGFVLFISIFSFLSALGRAGFDTDWQYVKAMDWANKNIRGKTVMSDPFTLYMFQSYSHIIPAYQELRSLRNLKENEFIQRIFLSADSQGAYEYLTKKRIQYVMFDTYWTPGWSGVLLEKFEDTTRYDLVYSIHRKNVDGEFKIYRVLPSTGQFSDDRLPQ